MTIPSFFKSTPFLCGSVFSGAGVVCIGGWKIYDALAHEDLLEVAGYSRTPISLPKSNTPVNNDFSWDNWGCFDRLFPNAEIKKDKVQDVGLQSLKDLDTPKDMSNPVGCAIMDLSPIVSSSGKKNFYFKSEVVVRGEGSGLVLWTGLSNVKKDNESANLGLRQSLIFMKKESEKWVATKGYRWSSSGVEFKYFIKTPEKFWVEGKDENQFTPKYEQWSGVWEVSNTPLSAGVFKDIQVYLDDGGNIEILGKEGEWQEEDLDEVIQMEGVYIQDKGWTEIAKGDTSANVKVTLDLNKWYAPLKDVKGTWTNLNDRCAQLFSSSNIEKNTLSGVGQLCFLKQN